VFHVIVQGITERNHLDQRREEEEEESQRIARNDDELLEQDRAEPAKWFVLHILTAKKLATQIFTGSR
jgi:hypothetical protein